MPQSSPTCAKVGCKGKAKGGSIFCAPHDYDTPHTGGAPAGNANAFRHGLYSLFSTDEQEAISAFGAVGDLSAAIEAMRVLLMRSFREDDRDRVIASVNALVRLEIAQHRLNGNQAGGLLKAVDDILAELGVGGDG